MVEQEGYVSLWVGKFKSTKELQHYLLISYTEDGDAIPSEFEKDFQIDWYDEDFMEAEYFDEEIEELPKLLDGCSYDDAVIPNFIQTYGKSLSDSVNSMILLYNFQCAPKEQSDLKHIKYLGNVKI